MAKFQACTIKTCTEDALWAITTEGHPNVEGVQTVVYCGTHALGSVPLWDDSPQPYTVTVKGPSRIPA